MDILVITKIFQAVRTNSKGFFFASTVEYVVIVATKVGHLTTYSPTAASFSIVTALNACICCICIDTFCGIAILTPPNASPNTCWFALLQYTWTIHIICQCSPTVDIAHDSRTSAAHMRCIKITHDNMNVRITVWHWSWFHFWFRSWFWCWLNLRFWSRFYLWFWSRFNFRLRRWSWLWFYFWFRCWFIFTIYVFTLTIFICLPSNVAFFGMTRCKHFKTTRFRTIRCNGYCALKVSFTINIVMIVHLVSQVI